MTNSTDLQNLVGKSPDYSYFVKTVKGIAVVHLQSSYNEDGRWEKNPSLDIHLHILFFQDHNLRQVSGICLDNGVIHIEPWVGNDNLQSALKIVSTELARTFVLQVASLRNVVDLTPEKASKIIFNSAPTILWDEFKRIRENTYVQYVSDFMKYMSAAPVVESTSVEPSLFDTEEMVEGRKLYLAESRLVRA